MGKKQIDKTIKLFVAKVETEFKPEKILLFGSYANNVATEYSDIDILVVASSFKHLSFEERLLQLHRLAVDLEPDINAFGFTQEEIEKQSYVTTIRDALTTGKYIFKSKLKMSGSVG